MIVRKVIDGFDDVIKGLVKTIGVPEEHAEKVVTGIEVGFALFIVAAMFG